MPTETVGDDIQHDRAIFLGQRELSSIRIDDSHNIKAIHALHMQLRRGDACAKPSEHIVGHGFAGRLSAHSVGVGGEVEDNRQTALVIGLFPKRAILIHRGKVHAFPNGAAAQRAIAQVCNGDTRLFIYFLIETRARCNAGRSADDSIIGVDAKRLECRVHGAAQPAQEANFPRKDLRHRAIQEKVLGHLLHIVARQLFANFLIQSTAHVVFHNLL